MSYLGTTVYPIVTLPALVTNSLGYQPVDSNTVTQLNTTTGSYANSAYATANTKFNTSGGTITGNTAVSVSSTIAALRITQTGTGNALVIEDEANPDGSPLVVDSSGNLGVGTSTPTQKLDVTGSILSSQSLTIGTSGLYQAGSLYSDSNWGMILRAKQASPVAANFAFMNSEGNELMRIDSAGNVGIGTSSPGAKLDVYAGISSAVDFTGLRMTNGGENGTNLDFYNAFGPLAQIKGTKTGGGGSADDGVLMFSTAANSALSEKMRIDTSGNLGLNTAAPVAKFSINSLVGTPLNYIDGTALQYTSNAGIRVTESNTGNAAIGGGIDLVNNVYSVGAYSPILGFSSLSSSGSFNNTYAGIYGVVTGAGADTNWVSGSLVFATTTSGAGLGERMRIDSSGNVGIGTTSNLASSKLDVRGRVRVGSGNSSGDAEVIWSNYASATTAWTASVRQDVGGANNDLKFLRFDSSGNYQGVAMQIDTSSRLNIGTASNPTTTNAPGTINLLAVGGDAINIKHTQNGNNLLNLWQTGTSGFSAIAFYKGDTQNIVGTIECTTTATTYNTSSDYRLKENVTSMTGALAKVAQLKPVTYTWKIDGSIGQGFIAHELQEVVPGAVTGEKDETYSNGNAKYQGVDTSFLVATLTAAIQEQQLIINQLLADVAALKGN